MIHRHDDKNSWKKYFKTLNHAEWKSFVLDSCRGIWSGWVRMFLWAGHDNRVTLSTWKICHPAYLTSCPHIFIPQVLIWEDLQRPEKGLEGSVRSAPRLRSAIQDGTLTRPAGDYEIFIDGRNVSLLSDLFGAIVKSDIKLSQVVSLFWTCCWTHKGPEAAASSRLWFNILSPGWAFLFCGAVELNVLSHSVKLSMKNFWWSCGFFDERGHSRWLAKLCFFTIRLIAKLLVDHLPIQVVLAKLFFMYEMQNSPVSYDVDVTCCSCCFSVSRN